MLAMARRPKKLTLNAVSVENKWLNVWLKDRSNSGSEKWRAKILSKKKIKKKNKKIFPESMVDCKLLSSLPRSTTTTSSRQRCACGSARWPQWFLGYECKRFFMQPSL
ncbi:unnamed protein product [Ceratitis capitata]|uniref:(Mediterranean fruit fly) hypothetical protein n=1 Tax=Ceratitis capitata TaxID=7213 RepID=A0A811V4W4_CERCA|nr:unnamed protein product [Ceratitis capitata]